MNLLEKFQQIFKVNKKGSQETKTSCEPFEYTIFQFIYAS